MVVPPTEIPPAEILQALVRKDNLVLGKNEARSIRLHRKVRELRKACKGRRPLRLAKLHKDYQRRRMVSRQLRRHTVNRKVKPMDNPLQARRTVSLKGKRMASLLPVRRMVKVRKGPMVNRRPVHRMVRRRKGNPMVRRRKGPMVNRQPVRRMVRYRKGNPSDSPEQHSRKHRMVHLPVHSDLPPDRMAKHRRDHRVPCLEPQDHRRKDMDRRRVSEPPDKTLAHLSNPMVGSVNRVQA